MHLCNANIRVTIHECQVVATGHIVCMTRFVLVSMHVVFIDLFALIRGLYAFRKRYVGFSKLCYIMQCDVHAYRRVLHVVGPPRPIRISTAHQTIHVYNSSRLGHIYICIYTRVAMFACYDVCIECISATQVCGTLPS